MLVFYLTLYLLYVSYGDDSAIQRELVISFEPWEQRIFVFVFDVTIIAYYNCFLLRSIVLCESSDNNLTWEYA